MKTLFSYLPKKHVGGWIVAAFALMLPLAASAAWGPDRPTYTYEGAGTAGADKVVFNSFVNHPDYGDERTFFDGKEASNTNEGGFQDGLNVDGHDELTLRVYVHNNADPSLNESGEGIARNTQVRVNLPEANGVNLRAIAHISADNAEPKVVTDTLDFDSKESPFQLEYIDGSAKIRTSEGTFALSDNIVTDGARIGHDQMDGNVPGCFAYDGIVTLKVKVKRADVKIVKEVKVSGSDQEFAQRNEAEVGDKLTYRIEFKNNGETELTSVNIGDNLPAFVDYVPGSTYIANDSTDFKPTKLDNDNLTDGSIDIGHYSPGANAVLFFQAEINDSLGQECGVATLRNVVLAKPEGLNNYQNAAITTVDTGNDCEPEQPEEPEEPEQPEQPEEEEPEEESEQKPDQIANTGVGSALMAITGSGAIGQAAISYAKSRKGLDSFLKK